jgi:transcriptional regulator with XRE-family HTH domain
VAKNWLKDRRRQINISQEELSARLQLEGFDVSQKAISSWETGRHSPNLIDPSFRLALAKALRMSVYSLLVSAGFEVSERGHSEAGERAAFIVDQLSQEKRELALGILEQFLASE